MADDKLMFELDTATHIELCWCPPNKFTIGQPIDSTISSGFDTPEVDVEITKGYWISSTMITYKHGKALGLISSSLNRLDTPIHNWNWFQARDFCKHLTGVFKEKLVSEFSDTAYFDIPTEVQWENACRANTHTAWFFGSDENYLQKYAWYNTFNMKIDKVEVGLKDANPWGLFDVYGLLFEWCRDEFIPYSEWNTFKDPFIDGAKEDVIAINKRLNISSRYKVVRGGDLWSPHNHCTSTARFFRNPKVFDKEYVGFRVVLVDG